MGLGLESSVMRIGPSTGFGFICRRKKRRYKEVCMVGTNRDLLGSKTGFSSKQDVEEHCFEALER